MALALHSKVHELVCKVNGVIAAGTKPAKHLDASCIQLIQNQRKEPAGLRGSFVRL